MPDLDYGKSAFSRKRGNLPELPVVNMFVEASRSERRGVVMQSRKGLAVEATVGSGPVRDTYEKDGVFNGDKFAVSGSTLYRGATALGIIDGTGPTYWASIDGELLVTRGATLWSYRAAGLTAVVFPDGANVTAVGYSSGYFVAIRSGTDQWYFSALYDGRAWDGLDFATAESEPDQLRDVVFLDGSPVFFGSNSVEFWSVTGDPAIPFAPIQQRSFEQGIFATGCAVQVDNSFYWLGGDRIIYRNDNTPIATADDGIVERAFASATHRLFLLTDERHKFICYRGDTFTMAYDVTTQQWCQFESYGRANFRCGPGMGDDETGVIWTFADYLDNGGVLERRIRAGAELSAPTIVNNIRLGCEIGATEYLTGAYATPQIELRTSRDAGRTWGNWRSATLGEQGQYRTRVEWRALGLFDESGILAEFRVTDPVPWRLSRAEVNAVGGGRSR